MAHEVLDRCYPEFSARRDRGNYFNLHAMTQGMYQAREQLGWVCDWQEYQVRFEEQGIVYKGTNGTRPSYWGYLQQQLSPSEVAAKKVLQFL
jgi:hypothetical protein